MSVINRGHITLTIEPSSQSEVDLFTGHFQDTGKLLFEGMVFCDQRASESFFDLHWRTRLSLSETRHRWRHQRTYENNWGSEKAIVLLEPEQGWYPFFVNADGTQRRGPWFGLNPHTKYNPAYTRKLIEDTAIAPIIRHLDDIMLLLTFIGNRLGYEFS